jgi:hypothetical protein
LTSPSKSIPARLIARIHKEAKMFEFVVYYHVLGAQNHPAHKVVNEASCFEVGRIRIKDGVTMFPIP